MSAAQVPAYHPVATQSQPAESDENVETTLSIALFEELANSLLLTATSASIATALAEPRHGCSPRMLANFLPPSPALFESNRFKPTSNATTRGMLGFLDAYYADLAFVKSIVTYSNNGERRSFEPAAAKGVAEVWRQLAVLELQTLDECASMLNPHLVRHYEARRKCASDLLKRIIAGQTPCIDAYGNVKIPLAADRRQAKRSAHNVQAFFMIGSSIQRAAILDAGPTGLGLQGLLEVPTGTRLELLLGPGVSIPGRVVWAKSDRQGIELDAPLPPGCKHPAKTAAGAA